MLRITADGDERAAMNNRWSFGIYNNNPNPCYIDSSQPASSSFRILHYITVGSDYKRIAMMMMAAAAGFSASRDVLKDKSTGYY